MKPIKWFVMNWPGIFITASYILMLLGFMMLFVPVIDILTGRSLTFSYLSTSLILITIGLILSRFKTEPLGLIESIILVSILWILLSIVSAIPLMISLNISFIDAWFESVSGFTGTGFTVLNGLDNMKPSIVTWRSMMQWVGELGVVVFAMIIFPYFYKLGARVYGIERPFKIEASFYRTARRLLITYSILTFMGIISLIYAGMNIYEAVNHMFTTISTGGMSTYDNGYQVIFNRSPYTYIPMVIFMFIGAMNFILLDRFIRGEFRSIWRSEEFKLYLFTSILLSTLTVLSYWLVEGIDLYNSLLYGVFNQLSGLTTTGFSLGSINSLKPVTKFLIIIGMFIGGMTFSTAGGIKVYRFLILLKKIRITAISVVITTRFEKIIKIDTTILDESEVSFTLIYPIIHIFVVIFGTLLISIYGYDFIDSLFESVSATSCVGLSTGVISASAPIPVKIIIIILMLLGRLEFIQLFLIIGYISGFRLVRVLK
ncbi:MAG: TrkH family potassium uptake protein [Desulfurococcaceae archaeon]